MTAPTPRQLAVLRYIDRHRAMLGYPPSVKEIGAAFDIASTHGVDDHLRALIKKGLLERARPNAARALTITHEGRKLLDGGAG